MRSLHGASQWKGGAILRDTLRFAHSEAHLRQAATEASLEIAYLDKASTRIEKNCPVEGLLAVLRVPAAQS